MTQKKKKTAGKKQPINPVAAPRRPPHLLLKALVPIVVIALASGAFFALANSKPETRPHKLREKVWTVEAVQVRIADHRPKLKLYGATMAGRKVDLRSLVAGEIIKTADSFREGAIVAKGDVLLTVDPFEFEASLAEARANLREARAKLDEINARINLETDQIAASKGELALARRDLERARQLLTQKLVSQKAVDDRQYTMSQRNQAVRQRISNLAIEKARAAQQEAALVRLKSKLRRAERELRIPG